jgi:hypothetical protein
MFQQNRLIIQSIHIRVIQLQLMVIHLQLLVLHHLQLIMLPMIILLLTKQVQLQMKLIIFHRQLVWFHIDRNTINHVKHHIQSIMFIINLQQCLIGKLILLRFSSITFISRSFVMFYISTFLFCICFFNLMTKY